MEICFNNDTLEANELISGGKILYNKPFKQYKWCKYFDLVWFVNLKDLKGSDKPNDKLDDNLFPRAGTSSCKYFLPINSLL